MANKIEVLNPIERTLDSKQPDDIKVKIILEALYRLLKNHGFSPEPVNREPDVSPRAPTNPFDYTKLSKDVSRKHAENVVSELGKVLSWDDNFEVTLGGKKIRNSNIIDLVKYLTRRTPSAVKKPSWYNRVSKVLRLINIREMRQRKAHKPFAWEGYGDV